MGALPVSPPMGHKRVTINPMRMGVKAWPLTLKFDRATWPFF